MSIVNNLPTSEEISLCQKIIDEMSSIDWIESLLLKIKKIGFPKKSIELLPFLFELQIAYEFFILGCNLEYEHNAGIGDTTVDFLYRNAELECLIEAVTIEKSKEVKKATRINIVSPGITEYECHLGGDGKASPGSEMVKLQGKIVKKASDKEGNPVKFPNIKENSVHIVVVDVRSYLIMGGDKYDYIQTMYGPSAVSPELRLPYRGKAVQGIFTYNGDDETTKAQAEAFTERVHYVIFTKRTNFETSLFSGNNYFLCWNPRHFSCLDSAMDRLRKVPVFCQ